MQAHNKAPNELAKQLHADAKEFVPSSVRDFVFIAHSNSIFINFVWNVSYSHLDYS
jgi:hypothetical protein